METARQLGDAALTATAASALGLGESAAGQIEAAREHRAEAVALLERLPDADLAPRLEALYYLGLGRELSGALRRRRLAHAERGDRDRPGGRRGAAAGPAACCQGCYPLEMQGRLAEAIEICETAVEAARLSDNPHYLFWALFELAWARYFAGDLDGAIDACEESLRVRRATEPAAPSPRPAAGRLGARGGRLQLGEIERAPRRCRSSAGTEIKNGFPVERCFDWETLALAELASGDRRRPSDRPQRGGLAAEVAGLHLPLGLAARTRAAVLLAGATSRAP